METESRLKACMQAAGQAYMQHCASDPEHAIGLLALSVDFPRGEGTQWIAHHWTGRDRKVRPAHLPESVAVSRLVGAAIMERPDSNLIYFLVGRRPGSEHWKIRMFVTYEDPYRLGDSDAWATGMIADFAASLTQDEEPSVQRTRSRWSRLWSRRVAK